MKSPASFHQGMAKSSRGSALTAALALVFLIFLITCVSLARVAASWTQIGIRHRQSSALFLAEAGIHNAAHQLLKDRAYNGEKNVTMPTGTFDVTVDKTQEGFIVTSIGHVKSPINKSSRKTVQATIEILDSDSFRITRWRENP